MIYISQTIQVKVFANVMEPRNDWELSEYPTEPFQTQQSLHGQSFSAELCDVVITVKFDESDIKIARKRRIKLEFVEKVPANYREKPNQTFAHLLANYFDQVTWEAVLKHREYIDPVCWDKPRLVQRAINEIKALQESAKQFLVLIQNGTVSNG
jgi:hypothetical protein